MLPLKLLKHLQERFLLLLIILMKLLNFHWQDRYISQLIRCYSRSKKYSRIVIIHKIEIKKNIINDDLT